MDEDYDEPAEYSTELDKIEDALAVEAECRALHEELLCPECDDDCGCEKCFFTGEIADSRECVHGTGDWRSCKQCNVGGWQPGDPTECAHGNVVKHCDECDHDAFIRERVLAGDCWECYGSVPSKGRLGPDHVCPDCGWDGKDFLAQ
jgi:hypothetical protein